MEDIKALRDKYKEITGKKCFNGWDAEQINQELEKFEVKTPIILDDEGFEESSDEIIKNTIEEDTIVVDKAEFNSLKALVQNLQKSQKSLEKQAGLGGGWEEYVEPKKANRTATIKIFKEDADQPEKFIIDWKHKKFIYKDVPASDGGYTSIIDKDIYNITLLNADDTEEIVEMPLPTFARINEHVVVEIISQEKKMFAKNQGKVSKTHQDKEGYRLAKSGAVVKTDEVVDLIVKMPKTVCTILFPDGRKREIPADRLNS